MRPRSCRGIKISGVRRSVALSRTSRTVAGAHEAFVHEGRNYARCSEEGRLWNCKAKLLLVDEAGLAEALLKKGRLRTVMGCLAMRQIGRPFGIEIKNLRCRSRCTVQPERRSATRKG